jgi:hypothetical protein
VSTERTTATQPKAKQSESVSACVCLCVRVCDFILLVLVAWLTYMYLTDLVDTRRREWRLTVPALDSDAVSLNGALLPSGAGPASSAPLPAIEPQGLAPNAAKASIVLPPLSVTFLELGLIPALGLPVVVP